MRALRPSVIVSALALVGCEPTYAPSSEPPAGVASDSAETDADTSEPGGDLPPSPLGDCSLFPADNDWNRRVGELQVHARDADWISVIGADTALGVHFGAEHGVPINQVTADTPWVEVPVAYAENSDPGPYPLAEDFRFEVAQGTVRQRRLVVVDPATCQLYELFDAERSADGAYAAVQALRFDLTSNALREPGWGYTDEGSEPGPVHDGSGLPLLPGLVRFDEVAAGHIGHAVRFRVPASRRAYVAPAVWAASVHTEARYPPMGARFRLRADVDCGAMPEQAAVVCTALQEYGMLLGENGDAFALEGELDGRWDPAALAALSTLTAGDFEAVYTGENTAY